MPTRWLPAITKNAARRRNATLVVAGLAFISSAIAGPAVVAGASPGAPGGGTATYLVSDRDSRGSDLTHRRSDRSVQHEYQTQPNFYYCGPAATRIALSAMGHQVGQDDLASQLGTTEAGTESAENVTRVLNRNIDRDAYRTVSIPGDAAQTASPAEMDRLQADVVRALDDDRPVVVNIIGTAFDTDGLPHSYPGGHYLTVVGYRDQGRTVQIADPANVNGVESYWMNTINLANWSATRGYSA